MELVFSAQYGSSPDFRTQRCKFFDLVEALDAASYFYGQHAAYYVATYVYVDGRKVATFGMNDVLEYRRGCGRY